MKTKTIAISYTNNISDRLNNFIRLCYKLCNKYQLSISSMKGFSSTDRSFEVEFVGSDSYLKLFYDYDENHLKYEISCKNEVNEKAITSYIITGITKVNYKSRDIIYDEYGNRYEVLEDTNIPLSEDGCRRSYKIFAKNEDGELVELSDVFVSSI